MPHLLKWSCYTLICSEKISMNVYLVVFSTFLRQFIWCLLNEVNLNKCTGLLQVCDIVTLGYDVNVLYYFNLISLNIFLIILLTFILRDLKTMLNRLIIKVTPPLKKLILWSWEFMFVSNINGYTYFKL